MPSMLNDDQKDTVKRLVHKASNKIIAVACARLYVAYPNSSEWTYTGLEGAIVLFNDLAGNTFRLKLVDVSDTCLGVLWEQEIYETWNYSRDNDRFHTFELESCLAGLSFAYEKEANTFYKVMMRRGDKASKNTRITSFSCRATEYPITGYPILDAFDPDWRERFGEDLINMGITDDMLLDNQDFVVNYFQRDRSELVDAAR